LRNLPIGQAFCITEFHGDGWTTDMATIKLVPDNVSARIWWINWVEKDEIIGRIVQDSSGRCEIAPSGPHWSPMKSFAAFSFDHPNAALAEVELYFRDR
jgi:hypothetical protein